MKRIRQFSQVITVVMLTSCVATEPALLDDPRLRALDARQEATDLATRADKMSKASPPGSDAAWERTFRAWDDVIHSATESIRQRRCSSSCAEMERVRGDATAGWAAFLRTSFQRFEAGEAAVSSERLGMGLIFAQRQPELVLALPFDKWIELVGAKTTSTLRERIALAGNIEEVVRKSGQGQCVFTRASGSHPADVEMKFAWAVDDASVVAHCTAPQPIYSYPRKGVDHLMLDFLETQWEDLSYSIEIPAGPAEHTVAVRIPTLELTRRIEAQRERILKAGGHLGRWILVRARYVIPRLESQEKLTGPAGEDVDRKNYTNAVVAQGSFYYRDF